MCKRRMGKGAVAFGTQSLEHVAQPRERPLRRGNEGFETIVPVTRSG